MRSTTTTPPRPLSPTSASVRTSAASGVPGWIRPGTTDEQIIALRASDVSGDWREVGGRQEMVAALAVNVAGLPTVRVEDGVQVALVAAGMIAKAGIDRDPVEDLADAIVARLDAREERRRKMRALADRVMGVK